MEVTQPRQAPPPPSTQENSALDRLLNRIHNAKEFPTISNYVLEINQKLDGDPDSSDASDLANIILKDHALTSKLLKMVNSAYYGLATGKVSTITRAVVVLGYENVRLATLSLALFEHFKSKPSEIPLKEAVIGSFWSGMMARELSTLVGGVNPEEAFVCSMMSLLGKLALIHYLPKDYNNVRTVMAKVGVSEFKAMLMVCKVSYEELGMTVAKQWNFPKKIYESMRPLSDEDLKKKDSAIDRLRLVTSLVKDLYDAIQSNPTLSSECHPDQILKRYQTHLKITENQLKRLIKASLEKTRRHAQVLSLNIGRSMFMDGLAALYIAQRQVPPEDPKETVPEKADSESMTSKDEEPAIEAEPLPEPHKISGIIIEGVQEISQTMLGDYSVEDVAVMTLEVFHRSLDFHRSLMFINDGEQKKMMARFGYGLDSHRLIGKLGFDLNTPKDLFTSALQLGKDLVVADTNNEKMRNLIPTWYRRNIDAPAFVFLPVCLKKVCIGALYADRQTAGQPVSEDEHRHLDMLRNQLVLSIKYKQG